MNVCPERTYQRGEVLFRSGDPATELHVIAEGQVKMLVPTLDGEERILAICGPDDFIGEALVGENALYRAEAVALTNVVSCPVSRRQFLQLSLKAPGFMLGFTKILADHLFSCRQQLASGYDTVMVRLSKVLLDQATRFGSQEEDGWVTLRTNLKHDEMAAMVSATRVSVSMAISGLRESGLVIGSRGNYRIHMPALADMVESVDG